MRKAQAALEFLTTYGWAFIVILVMIGALAYFGVLNPSKVTPSRCIVEAGINCKDFLINTTGISIVLINGKGEGMIINNVTVTSDVAVINTALCTPGAATSIGDGGNINIYCPVTSGLTTSVGDKVKLQFSVDYRLAKGTYNQTFGGSIYGQVQ